MESLSSSKRQAWLPWFYKGLLFFVFTLFIARLVDLQIIKGAYYQDLSVGNRIRRITVTAPRGIITARGGELLAGNREIKKAILFDEKEGYIKSDQWDASADTFITEYLRYYPLGVGGAHITGFLGEAKEEELGKVNPDCRDKGILKFDDLLGRSGLEKYYDCTLRGIDGEELIEVESDGRKARTLGTKEGKGGESIQTFIDYGLQKRASELLADKIGSIIITDIDGEILTLFSSPSYDPNAFNIKDDEKISVILKGEGNPLFNRTISGSYPPGSIYKPLLGLFALEEKKVDENFTYDDTGQILIQTAYGDFSYKNWYFTQYGGTEGTIDLKKALSRSTDTLFYKVGELLGIDKIDLWSEKFGLGVPTGIDLPGEISGLIPSPSWKEKVKGERWFLGNTYHLAIGQGDLLVTPLAIHRALSVIADGGRLCNPRLTGEQNCQNLHISKEALSYITEGMIMACSEGGTGYTFFEVNNGIFDSNASEDKKGKVACKTGTAQTFDYKEPHSWFTFFAPAESPQIVATVMVEHGGEGSKVAGPIARELYDYWVTQN